tara:strand:+ start:284 stop:487 length:204 start_codon:yes stop_codon:yes gene_type:complete
MTKIIEFPRIFKVKVQETRTRTYYVKADDELQAQERYLLEGMTSDLYDTEFDRMILDVENVKKIENE